MLLSSRAGGDATHLLSSGHLFPPRASGEDASVFAAPLGASEPQLVGRQVLNLLDEERPSDVALIELTDEGRALCVAQGPAVLGAEPTRMGGRWQARLWLAQQQRHTQPVWVRLDPLRARFRAALRPNGYVLRDLLRTSAPMSQHGDSGSPLLTAADRGRALGLLVGRKGVYGVFEPLDRALAALETRLGPGLVLCTKDSV